MKVSLKIWYAFLDLLEEQYADDLSVGKICEAAQVHRSSFYRYFKDIFSLVDFGISYQIQQDHFLNKSNDKSWAGLDFIIQHRQALRHLITIKYSYRFQQAVCRAIEKQVLQLFHSTELDYLSAVSPEWMARFYVGGMVYVIMEWLQGFVNNEQSDLVLKQQCALFREQIMRGCGVYLKD